MFTRRERTWTRIWFWVFYLLGPLTAMVANATAGRLLQTLPSQFRPWARMSNELLAIWAPVLCGALGAAYFLAKLYGFRSSPDVVAFTLLIGIALTISYFFLLFAGCIVVALLSALVAS